MLPYINQDTIFLLIAFLCVTVIGLVAYAIRNEYRIKRLLRGSHISDLEKSLIQTESRLKDFELFEEYADKKINDLREKIRSGARKIGIVRFSPFGKKDGANQSFAAAFVNEKGDGIVFSGLHARDRVTLFAKPVTENKSEYTLSSEEKRAIREARG